jgi:hypothetical protein
MGILFSGHRTATREGRAGPQGCVSTKKPAVDPSAVDTGYHLGCRSFSLSAVLWDLRSFN